MQDNNDKDKSTDDIVDDIIDNRFDDKIAEIIRDMLRKKYNVPENTDKKDNRHDMESKIFSQDISKSFNKLLAIHVISVAAILVVTILQGSMSIKLTDYQFVASVLAISGFNISVLLKKLINY